MSLDEALAAAVERAVAPLVARIETLTTEVAALRAASPSQWVSQQRAAELLGVSVQTIAAMAGRGELVTRHAGRRVLVDAGSLRPRDPGEVARLARAART